MLRISPIESGDGPVHLRLEGRVAGPWVGELWKACEKLLQEGRALVLNLAEVSFVDPAGVALISELKTRGIALRECSAFVEEQLNSS